MSVAENVEKIRDRIVRAARKAGRDPGSVTIVAVTKTVEPDQIKDALSAGIRILGENRVQEAEPKIRLIGSSSPHAAKERAQWHLVGHLQTNKARPAAALFDMVESVDSLRVAQALDREAGKLGRALPVLVQVNISGEESKFGAAAADALNLIRAVSALTYLRVEGLMTIPALSEDPEESRPVFRRLRQMADEIAAMDLPGIRMNHLSMGMSADFEVAVEEGATLVRVGTAIFGMRDKAL